MFITNSFKTKMIVITLLLILGSAVINIETELLKKLIENLKKAEKEATKGIENANKKKEVLTTVQIDATALRAHAAASGADEKAIKLKALASKAEEEAAKMSAKVAEEEEEYTQIRDMISRRLAESIRELEAASANANFKNLNSGIELEAEIPDQIGTSNIQKDIKFDVYQTHLSMQKLIVYIVLIATAALLLIAAGVFAFKTQQAKLQKDLCTDQSVLRKWTNEN